MNLDAQIMVVVHAATVFGSARLWILQMEVAIIVVPLDAGILLCNNFAKFNQRSLDNAEIIL